MTRVINLLMFIFLAVTASGQDSLIWKFSTNRRIFSSPEISENTMYIGSNDSCLYALNKKTGNLVYKFRTNGEIKSKPLIYNSSVIFNSSDGLVYAIDKNDAEVLWTFKTNGENKLDLWDYFLSSPVCSGDKVFVGSGDGNVYAIDPKTGSLIWKFKTGGIVHATPLVYENTVFIGSFDGLFYALNAQTGDLIWKFKTIGSEYFPKGEIQKGAALYKNSVIFGCRDYNIYSLNINTGVGMWNTKEKGSWVIAAPLIINDVIYVGTSDSHRFCVFNAQNGEEICSYPLNMRVYGEAVPHKNDIYFGCFNGGLYRINHLNGKLEEVFRTPGSKRNYFEVYNENGEFKEGFELYGNEMEASENKILDLGAILSTPVIDDGIIYFGDSNGVIYAVWGKE